MGDRRPSQQWPHRQPPPALPRARHGAVGALRSADWEFGSLELNLPASRRPNQAADGQCMGPRSSRGVFAPQPCGSPASQGPVDNTSARSSRHEVQWQRLLAHACRRPIPPTARQSPTRLLLPRRLWPPPQLLPPRGSIAGPQPGGRGGAVCAARHSHQMRPLSDQPSAQGGRGKPASPPSSLPLHLES